MLNDKLTSCRLVVGNHFEQKYRRNFFVEDRALAREGGLWAVGVLICYLP